MCNVSLESWCARCGQAGLCARLGGQTLREGGRVAWCPPHVGRAAHRWPTERETEELFWSVRQKRSDLVFNLQLEILPTPFLCLAKAQLNVNI